MKHLAASKLFEAPSKSQKNLSLKGQRIQENEVRGHFSNLYFKAGGGNGDKKSVRNGNTLYEQKTKVG